MALGLAEDRVYDDFATMAKREARRKNGIEAVAIVTPNHMHAPAAREFLKRGIHVICDKPLTATLAEAKKLAKAAAESDALFVLTHNYTGYPMIRQARAMVAEGLLGPIRVVQVEYAQDWLATPLEESGSEAGGLAHRPGALGRRRLDRRHRHARLQPGELRDRAEARGAGGGPAVVRAGAASSTTTATCCCASRAGRAACSGAARWRPATRTALRLRVYGEKGGLEWAQEDPNYLWYTPLGEPKGLLTRGGAGAGPDAARVTPDAGGPSRGLSRGLRQHLHRGGAGDPRAPRGQAGAAGRALSDDRGRRRRGGVRRGLRAVLGRNGAWVTP